MVMLTIGVHPGQADVMPKVRDWTNTHNWLVNILACALFIVLILA
ncbi:hypothetical protein [Streptomyces oryzae]|nr:hypothetical protein [Streptomyces oryzae]